MEFVKRVIAWALQRRAVRALLLYTERRGPMLADSITYRALFSVFAGVLLGFSAAAVWLSGNPDAWQAIVSAVSTAIPGLIGEDGVIKNPESIAMRQGLTLAGIISGVGLLAAALGAVGSLRAGVRTVAGTAMTDAGPVIVFLRNFLLAIGIAGAFLASALLSVLGQSGIRFVTDLLGLPSDSGFSDTALRALSLVIAFAMDAGLIAAVFVLLSGRKVPRRSLWTGSLLGAVGLVVLQQLSSLFVGGAAANPLLASFASLLALLIWLNFSAQVILIACAVIVTFAEEAEDRVSARFGAETFAQRGVQRAQIDVALAAEALRAARAVEKAERTAKR